MHFEIVSNLCLTYYIILFVNKSKLKTIVLPSRGTAISARSLRNDERRWLIILNFYVHDWLEFNLQITLTLWNFLSKNRKCGWLGKHENRSIKNMNTFSNLKCLVIKTKNEIFSTLLSTKYKYIYVITVDLYSINWYISISF